MLLFYYQLQTAYAGELFHVNAFDQPGVEMGKRLAYGLLGRKGYETVAEEFRRPRAVEKRCVLTVR